MFLNKIREVENHILVRVTHKWAPLPWADSRKSLPQPASLPRAPKHAEKTYIREGITCLCCCVQLAGHITEHLSVGATTV